MKYVTTCNLTQRGKLAIFHFSRAKLYHQAKFLLHVSVKACSLLRYSHHFLGPRTSNSSNIFCFLLREFFSSFLLMKRVRRGEWAEHCKNMLATKVHFSLIVLLFYQQLTVSVNKKMVMKKKKYKLTDIAGLAISQIRSQCYKRSQVLSFVWRQ